jgi:hypothetical protein
MSAVYPRLHDYDRIDWDFFVLQAAADCIRPMLNRLISRCHTVPGLLAILYEKSILEGGSSADARGPAFARRAKLLPCLP